MIGIDTNVLLRYTLDDDRKQSPIASRLLEKTAGDGPPILINPVVLVEFVWTLIRREEFEKSRIIALLDILAASERIEFTSRRATHSAIEQWRRGKAEFQDYLIGALNAESGASTTMTFDKTAAKQPDFSLLPF